MKNIRTKLCVTALALAIGVSPVLACTTVPKANTNRSNGAFLTVAEAENERKSSVPAKPETKPTPVPAVKPETKPTPAPIVKPETKPTPAPIVKPETKPTPAPIVKPGTKPTPAPIVKPGTKPTPPPTTTPGACKPETKPTPAPIVKPGTKPTPAPIVKPETKPTPAPEIKPNTCKPCKPETKPCKPETKPVEKFTIDNFKIIQQSLEKLGVSPSELDTMIKQGKKLIDVLNEKDISVNKFRKVLYKEYCLTIKAGVKNKQITKEEGKLLEAAIKQKVMSWMKDK
ncbi:MAG: hypothetical protein RR427_06340 [Cellulosilyticaceae bacterium]